MFLVTPLTWVPWILSHHIKHPFVQLFPIECKLSNFTSKYVAFGCISIFVVISKKKAYPCRSTCTICCVGPKRVYLYSAFQCGIGTHNQVMYQHSILKGPKYTTCNFIDHRFLINCLDLFWMLSLRMWVGYHSMNQHHNLIQPQWHCIYVGHVPFERPPQHHIQGSHAWNTQWVCVMANIFHAEGELH